MDILSIIGVVVAFGAILLGQHLDGGHIGALLNFPAILIVGGGTVGAIMLQSPLPVFLRALRMMVWIFKPPTQPIQEAVDQMVNWSKTARKEGLLGLESLVEDEKDLFSRKGLQLLVDGNEPDSIRETLELELGAREDADIQSAKVFEGMGGYSPTIGIIGAVMGLIHVMGHLADPSELGAGIAVAFVATIYGVSLANLFFLPVGNKLKALIRQQAHFRTMIIEGIVAIAEGENPTVIETRLTGFIL